jgi:hypothetical protein
VIEERFLAADADLLGDSLPIDIRRRHLAHYAIAARSLEVPAALFPRSFAIAQARSEPDRDKNNQGTKLLHDFPSDMFVSLFAGRFSTFFPSLVLFPRVHQRICLRFDAASARTLAK